MRIAFATCSAMPHGWEDDWPAARLLGAEFRCWDDGAVDWERYDRVVIRSTWDYVGRSDEFVAWCARVGAERLRNSPELVAFNVDKRYLAGLQVRTVPTDFIGPGDPPPALAGEVVVKPNVSSGARETGRFGPSAHAQAAALIARIQRSGRVALVQPYQALVQERGETALVFFAGELSHVLRKAPILAPDEEAPCLDDGLGPAVAMRRPDLVAAGRADRDERDFAASVMGEISHRFGTPLYARVDLLSAADGEPQLLELEVIEPNLYMACSPGAAERFAEAVRRC